MSKKKEEFSFIIEEHMGCLKQSEEHGWTKDIVKIIWGNNSPTVDIRNMNITQNRVGKGISLTNEECDKMVDILLNNGYGTVEQIKKALEERKNIFTPSQFNEEKPSELFTIEINTSGGGD